MTRTRFRSRPLGVLAVSAVVALGTTQAAQAATPAKTTDYDTATYLQNTLQFPASETAPALQPVTYDRFQWLLQQPGQLAILIGDPATDPSFKERARDVEAAADAAGAKTVYWFNPNLSGGARIGDVKEPNLDIRNAAGITALSTDAAKGKYRDAWGNLIAHYLGNGRKAEHPSVSTTTVTNDDTVVNDSGGTEVGKPSSAPLYDYRAGAVPDDLTDTVFVVYDKDRKVSGGAAAQKIVAWTDLGEAADSAAARTAITTAIGSVGGSAIDEHAEYAWWKGQSNAKHAAAVGQNASRGAGTKLFPDGNDAAEAENWRVQQITYPELVDLLQSGANDENAVILFGGVWCPNTRAVLPELNEAARKNGVTVYNFDTVLDGGLISGTTAGSNPLQIRNALSGGANPSFLYGDLVSTYLKNIKTEYLPDGGNAIEYYPGGDTTKATKKFRRLQVPFLVGYQRDGDGNGARRQWLIENQDGSSKEYMTERWLSAPKAGQVDLGTTLPAAAPAWSTLNQQIATATWDTPPASVVPNAALVADSASYLVDADRANVSTDGQTVTSNANGTVVVSPAALSSALAAVGLPANATLATAKSELVAAQNAGTDQARITNLRTVVGAWGVAANRKTTIGARWGEATNPNSILGGLAAIHAGEVFFDGLPRVADPNPGTPDPGTPDPGTPDPTPTTPVTPAPGPGATTPSVIVPTPITAPKPVATTPLAKVGKITGGVVKAPTTRRAGTYKVAIAVPKGASALAGRVTLKLKRGAVTKTLTGTLKKGVVTVKVPKLAKGTWKVTITWAGDARFAKASKSGKAIKVK